MIHRTHPADETYSARDYVLALNGSGPAMYRWAGTSYVRESSGGFHWEDAPAPEPGEATNASDWEALSRAAADHGPATHVEVKHTAAGDYLGSLVEVSNRESLARDYPDTFVRVEADYGSAWLLLPFDAEITGDLLDVLVSLAEEYPLYDEGDYSEREMDLATEAWDDYLRRDVERDLVMHPAGLTEDVVDDLDPEWLRDRYYALTSEMGSYPYAESAVSVVFPEHDAVISELITEVHAMMLDGTV